MVYVCLKCHTHLCPVTFTCVYLTRLGCICGMSHLHVCVWAVCVGWLWQFGLLITLWAAGMYSRLLTLFVQQNTGVLDGGIRVCPGTPQSHQLQDSCHQWLLEWGENGNNWFLFTVGKGCCSTYATSMACGVLLSPVPCEEHTLTSSNSLSCTVCCSIRVLSL